MHCMEVIYTPSSPEVGTYTEHIQHPRIQRKTSGIKLPKKYLSAGIYFNGNITRENSEIGNTWTKSKTFPKGAESIPKREHG